ncbi:hypothetical protein [Pedobacter insulae]|uniref:Uncharacterized protein n=1 Tax=Pedobacter insulae TaxID=414048 RepID=A0A1I2TCR8_9SPHI|nr:hypothetical protein [Pedobacter insulae]SFG62650.1 hypothetical protein SAMN04489864_101325 [Pedobacter insulae]
MKLFILFTKEINNLNIDKEDFVLSYYADIITDGNNLKVESGYYENDSYFEQVSTHFNNFSSQLNTSFAEVFESNKTIAYRNLQIPFKWIATINELLLNNPITEIIISDIVLNANYLPYYESEGEFTRQLLYKPFDFLPDLILQYLKSNHQKIDIVLLKKRSKVGLAWRIFGRRYILLFLKFLLLLVKFIKYKLGVRTVLLGASNNPEILFCSRGPAHLQYMQTLIGEKANYFTHVAEGITSSGQSISYLKTKNLAGEYYLNLMSFGDLFFSLTETLGLIFKTLFLNKTTFKHLGANLNLNSLLREMVIHQFDVKVYERNVERCLKNSSKLKTSIKILVTPEIYTPYAFVIAKLAKANNLKSLQVQTTEMRIIKRPNFIYCDKFLFSSKQKSQELIDKIPHQAELGDFWGNPTLNLTSQELYPIERTIDVVVYTQPRVEEEYDHIIISKLVSLKKSGLPIAIYIKPHPRELRSKFERYGIDITVYDSATSIDDSLTGKHLAFIKHSSVDSLILQNGRVPILYCLITKAARLYKLNHLTEVYQGTITDIDELENKLLNINLIREDYAKFKTEYFEFFYSSKDYRVFHEHLIKFATA